MAATKRRRSARGTPPTAEPVSWRDGVHVVGTPIWCDARRARDLCFVSAADRVGRAGHGQLIATAATLAQLGTPPGPHLPAPYRRPFTLGTLRLELMPSGHTLGGAVLLVDQGERRVLCAGVVAPRGGGLGEACEVRRADVLVLDAPYAAPHHVFPPVEEVIAAAVDDIAGAVARGAVVGVLVTSASKGLDVAARLAAAGVEVAAHRSIHHAARRLITGGFVVPAVRRPRLAPGALLWPVRERSRLPAVGRIVLVSGLATEADTVAALEVDAAYPWSNAADRAGLLEIASATGATRVYFTGRCATEAAAAVGEAARVLAAPHQMALFEEAAT